MTRAIDVLLINPNTSQATTQMMVAIAQREAPPGMTITGATARVGVPMILNEAQLAAAAREVVELGLTLPDSAGIIVSAFGDPGLAELRRLSPVPAVGICEAAMLAAAADGRRFGVATVTPELKAMIAAQVHQLGLAHLYTGIRLTDGEPLMLAANSARLEEALAGAVAACLYDDGAQAVVIGGGPLGQAAIALARRFAMPVIAPIPAAIHRLVALLAAQ